MYKILGIVSVMFAFCLTSTSVALADHSNPGGCQNWSPKIHNPNCNGGNPGGHQKHHGHDNNCDRDDHCPASGGFTINSNGLAQVSSVALCSPAGKYWPVDGDSASVWLAQGYTPAIYVDGYGTTCSLSDINVNPADYYLVPNVVVDNNGLEFSFADALTAGGASAIYREYRHR